MSLPQKIKEVDFIPVKITIDQLRKNPLRVSIWEKGNSEYYIVASTDSEALIDRFSDLMLAALRLQ